jgi:nucleoside-diphosphate-sugar epimerase
VVQLTSLPAALGPGTRRGFPANDVLRSVGVPRLVEAARSAGVKRVVFQSLTALAREVVDGPPPLRRATEALATAERAVARADESVVLRHGQLLGPATWFASGGSYARFARIRALPLVGDGSARSSYVHVDDAARAAVHALAVAPGTYEIGEVVEAGAFWPAFAEAVGVRRPRALPVALLRAAAGGYAAWFATTDLGTSGAPPLPEWEPRVSWRDALPR